MPDNPPIIIKQRIIFEGKDADAHRLEAYPAAQSLEGLIWALTIATNFGVSGKVRQRGDLSSSVKIFISPPRRGSLLYDLNLIVQENPFICLVAGGWAVNTVTPFINSLISYSFNSVVSGTRSVPTVAKKFFKKINDDDLEKLLNRIEPPLTRAHAVIGKTAGTIKLNASRTELVELNPETKSYLEARARDEFQTIETNATSFNVLTRNGRLYDPVSAQTVPFTLTNNAMSGSSDVITNSMRQYAQGREGTIRITAQRVETLEGRLKQLRISSAELIPKADWVDEIDPLTVRRTI